MATPVQTLDPEAFNQLVLEEHLPTWSSESFTYTGKHGKNGWELYRTYGDKWVWMYTARRVATQANAAGGAIIVDITVASGKSFEIAFAQGTNSGTNTLIARVNDEDGATLANLGYIASAAGNVMSLPSVGAATSTAGAFSRNGIVGPGQMLTILQSGAGAQNDTLTVAVSLLLPATASLADITWSVARSTNPGDVTLAASTISAANTWQRVLLP